MSAFGFLDDIITLASSLNDTNIMFEDLWKELESMCLFPQPKKLKVMADRFVQNDQVQVHMNGWPAERVESMEILGSIIQIEGVEFEAYQHRITQSWKVFHKWKDPLCAREVSIASRAKLWVATVQNSMTWALETTRNTNRNLQRLRAAQRRQFV